MSRTVQEGDLVIINQRGDRYEYVVRGFPQSGGILISPPEQEIFSLLAPVDGKWQVYGLTEPHTLEFKTPDEQIGLEVIPEEIILNEIFSKMSVEEILKSCETNRNINRLCRNESLWRLLFARDFGVTPRNYTGSWRELYITKIREIWVVGDNQYGQLGTGDTASVPVLQRLTQLKAKHVSTSFSHTLAIDLNNNVWFWGAWKKSEPIRVPTLKAKQVAAGFGISLILDLEGNVWLASHERMPGHIDHVRDLNQGILKVADIMSPTLLMRGAKQVSAGQDSILIIDANDNIIQGYIEEPGMILSRINIKAKQVSAGANHNLAIDINSNVFAWGNNDFGQLGGTGGFIQLPIKAKQVAAGIEASALIDLENNVWIWGQSPNGQINVPTQISNFKAKSISVGSNFAAIDFEHHVWVWGINLGALGLSLAPDIRVVNNPTLLPDFIAQEVTVGYNHMILIGTEIKD